MSVLGSLRAAREWAYPKLTKSAFLEKGVLTPEEFVQAGDELVYKCPTWAWESGELSKQKSYLPPDKQYLITRNVPCQNRVSSMETAMSTVHAGESTNEDEDWLVSTIIQQAEKDDDGNDIGKNGPGRDDDDFDILDSEGEVIAPDPQSPSASGTAENSTNQKSNDDEEEEEYADMADYEDDNVLMDDDAAADATSKRAATSSSSASSSSIIKVRTYDVSITYDKYYQTPRVWMIGRNAQDQPLTAKEMMEDVISDYANKTVTMENHPHVSGHHASIHPCQHGKVMKAIVRNLIKANDKISAAAAASSSSSSPSSMKNSEAALSSGPSVEMYLFIFLKFVSSIIPTMNYDFTMEVTADTSK